MPCGTKKSRSQYHNARTLHHGPMRARQRGEMVGNERALGRQVGLPDHVAGRIERVNPDGPLVEIYAGVQHRGGSNRGETLSIQLPGLATFDVRPTPIGGNVSRYSRSSQCRRTIGLLLIAACGSGCYVWRTQPVAPAQIMADRQTSKLRITRNDGSQVILEQPTMRGDTLLGIVRGNRSTADEVRIPLSDVREVAKEHLSARRTAALVAGVAAGAFVAAVGVLIETACPSSRDC